MSAELTIYYDHSCPLCRNEMTMLADRCQPGRVRLVDASAADFDNDTGVPTELLMKRIHARNAAGELITGMEVLRAAYRCAGLGWVMAPTAWPGLRPVFDRLYVLVADNRYRAPAWIVRAFSRGSACHNGQCRL
ncbi:MAG: DUF393 domain-containing protein [Pseudazoarcus pumilus]|nr:DUF393 domain-containing protein [Pseudazoarcus pumilus]